MHIGILQTGHAPDAVKARDGDYDELFQKLLADRGLTFSSWSVVDGEFPPGIDAAEGWLITGSRHGAYEALDWIPPLEEFIREAHVHKVPMVGICFGHQVIAQALGGKVEKFGGGWCVGPQSYDFEGTPVTLNAWHQDQVVEKPAAARVVATHPFCDYAALAYGDDILTIQAHPEYSAQTFETLARTRGPGVVPDPLLDEAFGKLSQPNDNVVMADRIATFLKEAAHG